MELKTIVIVTFYKFILLEDCQSFRQYLLKICNQQQIRGTILLAKEGINATIAGSRKSIDTLINYLLKDQRFNNIRYKESLHTTMPFHRIKIKLRNEIVTLGVPEIDPSRMSGVHVPPDQWNMLINDPEVLVIDVRNKYESDIGTFRNAVPSQTKTFRDFPDYAKEKLDSQKNKKIAIFCTGGIRCEKASSYMLSEGFKEVYQLQGGILRYLEKINTDNNLWKGECFVFDGRVSLNQKLQKGEHDQCFACRHPVSLIEKRSHKYEEGVSCPYCFDILTIERRARMKERQHQVTIAKKRNQQHIGVSQEKHEEIFF